MDLVFSEPGSAGERRILWLRAEEKFDKYDTSRDGKIGFDEFVLFLKGELRALTVGVTLEEQQKLKEVLDTLARDCLLMLLEAAG